MNDFDYEFKLSIRGKDRHADIYILVNNSAIFVETKKYSKDLDEDDVRQLIEYLSMHSVLWGLLTNGRQYYLINNSINIHDGNGTKNILNKVVFIDFLKQTYPIPLIPELVFQQPKE